MTIETLTRLRCDLPGCTHVSPPLKRGVLPPGWVQLPGRQERPALDVGDLFVAVRPRTDYCSRYHAELAVQHLRPPVLIEEPMTMQEYI